MIQVTPKKAKCTLAEANFVKKYIFFVPAEGNHKLVPSSDLTQKGDNLAQVALFTIEATNFKGEALLIEAWDKAASFVAKFFK